MVLATELADWRRFGSARELMAYSGLVPREHSSGERQRRGSITKAGKSHVRLVLVSTDQGAQFTSAACLDVLRAHRIQSSMDGRGCWRDNVFVERLWRSVKYEEVYLHAYESLAAVRRGLQRFSINSGHTPRMPA